MNDFHQNVQKLCELAKTALAFPINSDEALTAFENYCQAFSEWSDLFNSESFSDLTILDNDKLILHELSELHEGLLSRSKEGLGDTAEQLQGLKARAKGIMAYVDILPKKISVTKPHRG